MSVDLEQMHADLVELKTDVKWLVEERKTFKSSRLVKWTICVPIALMMIGWGITYVKRVDILAAIHKSEIAKFEYSKGVTVYEKGNR